MWFVSILSRKLFPAFINPHAAIIGLPAVISCSSKASAFCNNEACEGVQTLTIGGSRCVKGEENGLTLLERVNGQKKRNLRRPTIIDRKREDKSRAWR